MMKLGRIEFEELPEFSRDKKFLTKRFRSLPDDLSVLMKVLNDEPNEAPPLSFQMELLETLRKTFGTISGRVQKSPEENTADLKSLYETFTAYLQNNFGDTLENLRKEFGETLEEHQRKNTEKKVFVLMLITIDNFVLSEDVASVLGISLSTVKRYLKELKDLGLIFRTGSDKSGFWNLFSKS